MEGRYSLDEVDAVLYVAERVGDMLKRMDAMPELKAKVVCPHCRCYDKDVWDQVVLHGIPCSVSCMRGLSQWIEEEAGKTIRAQSFAKQDDAPRPAVVAKVGPDDWPGEQLR